MKRILIATLALAASTTTASAACSNPCGLEEMLTCIRQEGYPTETDNASLYQDFIVSPTLVDGYCAKPIPAGSTKLQEYYYDNFCKTEKGTYYSYDNLIAGAKAFPTFLCDSNTTYDDKKKELAAVLATFAQETTGNGADVNIPNYSRDGLYYRWETAWLLGSDTTYQTPYYPDDGWKVAVANGKTYTAKYWYKTDDSGYAELDVTACPMTKTWVPTSSPIPVPNGYTLTNLNQLVAPGYWVGMGATQLTGESMMGYFGSYYQFLQGGAATQAADFTAFVQNVLVDGVRGFEGSFWYWMCHINGNTKEGYRPVNTIMTDSTKPVCHSIGEATYAVNGGCNNADQRVSYYQYFTGALKVSINKVTTTVGSATLDSEACSIDLGTYCR